ncbi:MAG: UDP-N-acetylglucosamine--N-acetylmuramyl-(pentapeptide) pyrophosphoryl-undecaprenol N-acetylglucosamine transferase [Actinomycetota bacterium]|jgi:UDP-N-acetylglucosamine--N-acetylmuramyl-(pentapeptide) pyrophosphoryl-undecaprenol N-acetylglucosamine transferase
MVTPASHTFAVITGGGTSGHVVPAIAIAELLVDAGHEMSTLHYVGSNRGAEVAMIPAIGLAHTFLAVDGLQRGISLAQMKRNVLMVPTMLRALRAAKSLLRQLKPHVVVSVGGYASIPTCRAARSLGIPVVTCSYDRRPGLATSLQSRYAAASAVAYLPSTLRNAVLTGAPVRRNLRTADVHALRNSARVSLGISAGARVVVVMGGSLGSAVLNTVTEHLVQNLRGTEHTCVLHIAGDRFMNSVQLPITMHHDNGTLSYLRIAYSHDMITMYSAADVVVCRAGASTIAEVSTVGVCAVIVPWKDAAENHQLVNAKWLTDRDGAVLIEEAALTAHHFSQVVTELLRDDDQRAKIASRARELGEVHRQSSMARVIEQAAKARL